VSTPARVRADRFPVLGVVLLLFFYAMGIGGVVAGIIALLNGTMPPAPALAAIGMGGISLALAVTATRGAVRQHRRGDAGEPALATRPATAVKPRRVRVPADQLLAEWTLAPDEWRAYNEGEALEMRRDLVHNTLVGLGFGVMVVKIFGGPWLYAVLAGLLIGGMILAGTSVSIARVRKRVPRMGGGVVIRGNFVEIDGVPSRLSDESWYLSGAKLRKDLPLPVIEIRTCRTRYERNGSRRPVADLLRIPVPHGREEEAAQVAELLGRGRLVDENDG
jgi:hypothetical protein